MPPRPRLAKLREPQNLYVFLSASQALFISLAVSVSLIFQTDSAGLNPFRLVVVGTVFEATKFLCEVPTGVIADTVSRRLSVLIGFIFAGAGFVVSGAFAAFETILLGYAIYGVGFAFISGAKQAWIADEVGTEAAARTYLRSAQFDQMARIVAIPLAFVLASWSLNLPIVLGGALFFPLTLFLAFAMPERGFRPQDPGKVFFARSMARTLKGGGRLIGERPILLTIFGITALYGIASEGFDRLWVAHFYDVGFPAVAELGPLAWLGLARTGAPVLAIVAVEVVRRKVDTNDHAVVSQWLVAIYSIQFVSFVVLGLAGHFFVAMASFWAVISMASAFRPLYEGWLNQNVESSVRATVFSMNSQVNAIAQIGGGPVLGVVGSVVSVRAAFLTAAGVMATALPLFARGYRQGNRVSS